MISDKDVNNRNGDLHVQLERHHEEVVIARSQGSREVLYCRQALNIVKSHHNMILFYISLQSNCNFFQYRRMNCCLVTVLSDSESNRIRYARECRRRWQRLRFSTACDDI